MLNFRDFYLNIANQFQENSFNKSQKFNQFQLTSLSETIEKPKSRKQNQKKKIDNTSKVSNGLKKKFQKESDQIIDSILKFQQKNKKYKQQKLISLNEENDSDGLIDDNIKEQNQYIKTQEYNKVQEINNIFDSSHEKSKNQQNQQIKCSVCFKNFKTERRLQIHQKKKHQNGIKYQDQQYNPQSKINSRTLRNHQKSKYDQRNTELDQTNFKCQQINHQVKVQSNNVHNNNKKVKNQKSKFQSSYSVSNNDYDQSYFDDSKSKEKNKRGRKPKLQKDKNYCDTKRQLKTQTIQLSDHSSLVTLRFLPSNKKISENIIMKQKVLKSNYLIQCICNRSIYTRLKLNEHIKNEHLNSNTMGNFYIQQFYSPQRQLYYDRVTLMKPQQVDNHSYQKINLIKMNYMQLQNRFILEKLDCSWYMNNQQSSQIYNRQIKIQRYQCKYCRKLYYHQKFLKIHLLNIHKQYFRNKNQQQNIYIKKKRKRNSQNQKLMLIVEQQLTKNINKFIPINNKQKIFLNGKRISNMKYLTKCYCGQYFFQKYHLVKHVKDFHSQIIQNQRFLIESYFNKELLLRLDKVIAEQFINNQLLTYHQHNLFLLSINHPYSEKKLKINGQITLQNNPQLYQSFVVTQEEQNQIIKSQFNQFISVQKVKEQQVNPVKEQAQQIEHNNQSTTNNQQQNNQKKFHVFKITPQMRQKIQKWKLDLIANNFIPLSNRLSNTDQLILRQKQRYLIECCCHTYFDKFKSLKGHIQVKHCNEKTYDNFYLESYFRKQEEFYYQKVLLITQQERNQLSKYKKLIKVDFSVMLMRAGPRKQRNRRSDYKKGSNNRSKGKKAYSQYSEDQDSEEEQFSNEQQLQLAQKKIKYQQGQYSKSKAPKKVINKKNIKNKPIKYNNNKIKQQNGFDENLNYQLDQLSIDLFSSKNQTEIYFDSDDQN